MPLARNTKGKRHASNAPAAWWVGSPPGGRPQDPCLKSTSLSGATTKRILVRVSSPRTLADSAPLYADGHQVDETGSVPETIHAQIKASIFFAQWREKRRS